MPRLPFRTIAVSGSSMNPTYSDGDWLLFKANKRLQANQIQRMVGRVVIVERTNYPGILYIKRLLRVDGALCWVEGDNKEGSTDSRQWGALTYPEIVGLVLLRYRRQKTKKVIE